MDKEKQIDNLLTRGVSEVIDREHLRLRLLSGENLRVKFGIDPTSQNIHLGRSVPLLKLRDFQDLGHTIVFIVGDFTGQIGDTSDKESERPMLSESDVHANMATYAEQAGKILDMTHVEIHANSTWLSHLGFGEIGKEADVFSVAEFIARENIRKRLDTGKRVSLREMLYPLMQGHDSLAVSADVEIGGTDQRFNLLAGRRLQERAGKSPQDILTTNLILGIDGRKMSSSWGNTINLTDAPNDMFGKVMSVPDELIESYFVHCTRMPMEEVGNIMEVGNPRDAKIRLGFEIVKIYHGEEAAREAQEYFVSTFSRREVPSDIREVTLSQEMSLLDFLAQEGFATSRGDARRKIEQGGVEVDGTKVLDRDFVLTNNGKSSIVKCGKKDFARVVF
ncbi:MAG: tyrosine--tRNA ligase [Candidatus Moraniibacteriota bacterium]|nr:MAG: tyrosine--tRNA ligase [Candidatus Moranbacteria bacterium]